MSGLVTILTFNYPHEAIVIQSRLESEGIPCFIKDGFIAQVHPFYSTAVGGVKLQVNESDAQAAIEILKEAGYKPEEDIQSVKLHYAFEKIIPVFAKWRTLVIVLLIAAVIAFIINANQSSIYEELTGNNWCVDYVTYNNKNYRPYTYGNRFDDNFCPENIQFKENGDLVLPGFQSIPIKGKWELLKHDADEVYFSEEISIYQLDTLEHIFDKVYYIKMDDDKLVLWDTETIIYCSK